MEACFGELREFLGRSYSGLFDSELAGPDQSTALQETAAQVLSTLSMSQPTVRRAGLDLLGEFDLESRQAVLLEVHGRLEHETDTQIRRELIDFLLEVPPHGIKGVIAWRPHETDSGLIRYLDGIIKNHREEEARLAAEKQQELDASMIRIDELVTELKTATNANVDNIRQELLGLGNLAVQPVARMLYQPGLENRYAVNTGFDVVASAGPSALPILEVLAKCQNERVWRKAVDALHDGGPPSESHFRVLLRVQRPALHLAVLRKLSKFGVLHDDTLLEIARSLTVEESGIDNTAYAILIKHEASRELLSRASQSPNVRDSLRKSIQRRLQRTNIDPIP